MILPHGHRDNFKIKTDLFWYAIHQVLVITDRLHPGTIVSAHDEYSTFGRQVRSQPCISFNPSDLCIQQRHNSTRVFHNFFSLILTLSQLLMLGKFKIDGPIYIQLLLPLRQQSLEHQYLIITNIILRINMYQFSECYIGVSFLWLSTVLGILIIFSKILRQIDALLKPIVAAPCHGDLIEVFK